MSSGAWVLSYTEAESPVTEEQRAREERGAFEPREESQRLAAATKKAVAASAIDLAYEHLAEAKSALAASAATYIGETAMSDELQKMDAAVASCFAALGVAALAWRLEFGRVHASE